MKEAIRLRDVALAPGGPGITLSIHAGQFVAIVGPSGSEKSRLLHVIAGLEKPARGEVRVAGNAIFAEEAPQRKSTPQSLARSKPGAGQATRASDALNATRLWEVRQRSLSELSAEQIAGAELLALLAADAPVLAMDGQLDRLDPWTLQSTREMLDRRMREGAAVLAVTNRCDIAAASDVVIALQGAAVRFAGPPGDLLRHETHQFTVSAESQAGVQALVESFSVEVEQLEGGLLRLTAAEGQALAARLLLEGYGNVRFAIVRQPTLEEALLGLIRG